MNPQLVIVGAGGFGREVLAWALDAEASGREWTAAGFVDDDPGVLRGFNAVRPLLGSIKEFRPSDHHILVCAIGRPTLRLEICRDLREKGGRFATLVHPRATLAPSASIAPGCILCPGAVVTSDACVGEFTILNVNSCVGHDARLGAGCTLSPHADVNGAARLGTGVFLGSHAVVLPGAEVGDFAVVGAGSVVIRRVPAGATVFGVPARRIGGFEPEGLD